MRRKQTVTIIACAPNSTSLTHALSAARGERPTDVRAELLREAKSPQLDVVAAEGAGRAIARRLVLVAKRASNGSRPGQPAIGGRDARSAMGVQLYRGGGGLAFGAAAEEAVRHDWFRCARYGLVADVRRRLLPGFGCGRSPRKKGLVFPADPPTVEEIVAVMRCAGDARHGLRTRALIVVLWRAGLRISEALSLSESDLDPSRGRAENVNGMLKTRRVSNINDTTTTSTTRLSTQAPECPAKRGRSNLHS